jgi:membrane-bound lytic murein transglycosylase D
MTTLARRRALALFPFLILLLVGCAGTDNRQASTGTFPVAPEIQPNVDFWRHVYGVWSRKQVAFHDEQYMGIVYEVSDVPGASGGSYSSQQRRNVQAKKAWYKSRLATLERKVSRGDSLSRDERALYDKIVDGGGKHALIGASDRVRSQRGIREKFRRGLEISGRYDDTFRDIFRSRGLPEDLAYLPHVESSFQVNARSGVGAAGIWQFMPATGRVYGMTVNHAVDDRLDPVIAAEGAAGYLGSAYSKLGSWPLAVTSYNHGQGGMAKAKAIYGNDFGAIATRYKGPYFGFSSRNFYAQFVAAREVAGNPKKYFPEGVHYEKPLSHHRLVLRASMPAHHVASHYGVSTHRLAGLNLHWRDSALSGRANLPAGTTVWLPDGALDRVAGQPSYAPAMVARSEPKARPTASMGDALARAQLAPKAKAKPAAELKVARAEPAPKVKAKAKSSAAPKIARSEPAPKVQAKSKVSAAPKIARSEPAPKAQAKSKVSAGPKIARAEPGAKSKSSKAVSHHVVQPNETLYRVAVRYDISVQELKRLNKIKSDNNTIRPGQKLRVSS